MSETSSSGLAAIEYDLLTETVRKRVEDTRTCPNGHADIDKFKRMQSLLDACKVLAEVPAVLAKGNEANATDSPAVQKLFEEVVERQGEITAFAARESRRLLLDLAAVAIHEAGQIRV